MILLLMLVFFFACTETVVADGVDGIIHGDGAGETDEISIDLTHTVKPVVTKTTIPSSRTTIAPIHTKAPEIKPPADQQSVTETPTQSVVKTPVETTVTTATITPKTTPLPTKTGDAENPETYYQWGVAYESLGELNAAIEEYDKAIARDPAFADAWYRKGEALEKLGLINEAFEAYKLLLAIDPSYSAINESVNFTALKHNITVNVTPAKPPKPDMNSAFNLGPVFFAVFIILVALFGASYIYNRKNPGFISSKLPAKANDVVESQIGRKKSVLPDISVIIDKTDAYYAGNKDVLKSLLTITAELSQEGREGKAVGTAFVVGDSEQVLRKSRQLILNPLAGHPHEKRLITNPEMKEYFKELAQLDGAFVVSDEGVVEAAGRYISIDTSNVEVPEGFGTRHVSIAAITKETKAIGIVLSESGGGIRIFANGGIVYDTSVS